MQRKGSVRTTIIGLGALAACVAAMLGASFLLAPVWPSPAVDARPPDATVVTPSTRPVAPLAVTRIAHASVLLDFDGVRVLTDPWFTEKWHYHQGEPLGLRLV